RWRYTDGVSPTWLRKATIILGIVAVLIALAIVGSIVLPRWWAQIVVGWVQGVSSTGILAGLGCGFLFTLLPAIGIWVAWRARWRSSAASCCPGGGRRTLSAGCKGSPAPGSLPDSVADTCSRSCRRSASGWHGVRGGAGRCAPEWLPAAPWWPCPMCSPS